MTARTESRDARVHAEMVERVAAGLDPLTGLPMVTVSKITSTAGRLHDETGRTVTLDDAGRWVYSAEHETDADCAGLIDPETDCCTVCRVDHGAECDFCGGRGFHAAGCELLARLQS